MRLKTIVSPSVSRALEQVSSELGPHALILETAQEGELTRVVAADVEREEPIEGLMRLRAEIALLRRELAQQNEIVRRLVAEQRAAPAALPNAALTEPAAVASQPAPTAALPEPFKRAPAPRPRLALIERRLREQGVRPELIERVLTACGEAPPTEGDPLVPSKSDWCATALAGMVPGIGPNGSAKARCFVFVGPQGVGKSTAIAKLLQQAKSTDLANIAVISLDERTHGVQLLQRTATRLRIRYAVARGAEELVRAIRDLGDPRTLLVDTSGLGPRERRAIAALQERIPQAGQVAVHLVLRGDAEDATVQVAARPFAELSPSSLILTRLDSASRLGVLVNAPATLALPVAALSHGVAIAGDLTIPTRRHLADLVLGRKMLGRR